jgi:hypothetical protein
MSKYTRSSRRGAKTQKADVPAIWRGIGCIMFIVIPAVSFVAAQWTVQTAVDQGLPVPYQLMGYPVLPAWLLASDVIAPVVLFLEAQNNLWAILLMTLVFIVVLGGLISVVYAVMYRYAGPPRLGPLDAPPPRVAVKRYKR